MRLCVLSVRCGDVHCGSWLCENARTLGGDRTSYSFKPVLGVKLASAFKLENELKNVIPAGFRSFAFLHSQGHKQPMPTERGDFRLTLQD